MSPNVEVFIQCRVIFLLRSRKVTCQPPDGCSTWVMMNKDNRRIAKVPRDVRAEITPFFVDRAVMAEVPRRLNKFGETAQFTQSGLRVRMQSKITPSEKHSRVLSCVLRPCCCFAGFQKRH